MKVTYKRLICIVLVAVMLFALAGCGATDTPQDIEDDKQTTQPTGDSGITTPIDGEPTEPAETDSDEGVETPQPTKQLQTGVSYEITYQDSFMYETSVEPVNFFGVVEVLNTGTVDLYMYEAEFELQSPDGTRLGATGYTHAVPTAIAPGERGYYYYIGSLFEVEEGVNLSTDLQYVFKPHVKLDELEKAMTRFPVTDLVISEGDGFQSFVATGKVTNTTDELADLARIHVILYREDGTPICVSSHYLDDISAGESLEFIVDEWYLGWDFDFTAIAYAYAYAGLDSFQW